jgi:hypothetical protein
MSVSLAFAVSISNNFVSTLTPFKVRLGADTGPVIIPPDLLKYILFASPSVSAVSSVSNTAGLKKGKIAVGGA